MLQKVTRITAFVGILLAINAATSTSVMAQGGPEKTTGPALAPLAATIADGSSKMMDGARQMQQAAKMLQNGDDIAKVKVLMAQADKNFQAGKQAITEAKSRIPAHKELMPKKDECKLMMQSADKKGHGMMCMKGSRASHTQKQLTQGQKSQDEGARKLQALPAATQ